MKSFFGIGWATRWERVLRAVASVPGPEGEALLEALARTHRDIADYEAVGDGPARAMFEYLFGQIGSDDDFIAMVKKYAANRRAYDDHMAAAVRAVALREVPAQQSPRG